MNEKLKVIIERLKSPVVWFGLIAVILSAAQISPTNMTSWDILWGNIVSAALNPFLVGTTIVAIYAFLNNPADKENF